MMSFSAQRFVRSLILLMAAEASKKQKASFGSKVVTLILLGDFAGLKNAPNHFFNGRIGHGKILDWQVGQNAGDGLG